MFRKTILLILVAGLVILNFACNNYSKIMKGGNSELKYETGVDLYENGDFAKALQFFDILRAVHRGTEKGERLTYYTANCYFQMKDYQIASYYYKQYVQNYPRSEEAEESAFLSAYCTYLESPRASLDQTNTYIALRELQSFIDMYPNNDTKVTESHRLMDDLRAKLEVKSFNTGMLYYKMGDYQAAIASLENLLDEYPDTEFKEDVLFSITKAYYTYAEKSVFTKRDERYEKTIESYNNLLYFFPESDYLKEVEGLNEKAHDNLKDK